MTENAPVTRADFDRYHAPNYAPSDFVLVRGEGSRVWDADGKEFIDLAGGIAVTSVGHCHPEVNKALIDQATKLWHVSNLHTNEPALELAKQLVASTFADKVLFCNSGAEANEGALKMARRWAFNVHGEQKDEIISFTNSFHGRTLFTVTAGGQPKYSQGFGPLPGAITHLPFNGVDALKAAVTQKTCAVIVEPIQGEGGVNPATTKFLVAARELCEANDALLVIDEVQTGNGRTGKLFAHEHSGVVPDIMSTAKGMGNGFPIGAVLAKEEIAKHLVPGTHGTTYGGNPLGCAVALAVHKIISNKDTLDGVNSKGEHLMQSLRDMNFFAEVRGAGLLVGAALPDTHKGRAGELVKLAAQNGVLMLVAGPDVVRFAPSLLIEDDVLDLAIERLISLVAEFSVT